MSDAAPSIIFINGEPRRIEQTELRKHWSGREQSRQIIRFGTPPDEPDWNRTAYLLWFTNGTWILAHQRRNATIINGEFVPINKAVEWLSMKGFEIPDDVLSAIPSVGTSQTPKNAGNNLSSESVVLLLNLVDAAILPAVQDFVEIGQAMKRERLDYLIRDNLPHIEGDKLARSQIVLLLDAASLMRNQDDERTVYQEHASIQQAGRERWLYIRDILTRFIDLLRSKPKSAPQVLHIEKEPGQPAKTVYGTFNPFEVQYFPGASQTPLPTGFGEAEPQAAATKSQPNANPSPRVVIGNTYSDPVIVNGIPKRLKTYQRFKVVKALVQAGEEGLSKGQLEEIASGYWRMLQSLIEDPDWKEVIHLPGEAHRKYRIK